MAQPKRDLAQVTGGLQDHHRTRVPQHMRGDVLLLQRRTARSCETHILVEHVGEAHACHGTVVCTQEHFWNGEITSNCQPRPEIIGRLCPEGESAFSASFALDLY